MGYMQDGSPDVAFGDEGFVLKSFGESSLNISSVSQGESGRIGIIGTEYPILIDTLPFIQVFNEDGSIDPSFGDNGSLDISSQSGAPVTGINVLSDDRILYGFGGSAIKLLPDGERDFSFGVNGAIAIDISGVDGLNYALHPDGSIYLYGVKFQAQQKFVAKKFMSNGIIDTTFGSQGVAQFEIDPFFSFHKKPLCFLENGKILVNYSNSETSGSDSTNYVVRLNQNGNVDTTFGNDGRIAIYFEGKRNTGFHLLNTESFFLSYAAYINEEIIRQTQKFNPNGVLDTSFANNGVLDGHSVSFVQDNQRIITNSTATDFEGGLIPALSRYFPAGIVDSSFNFQYNYSELSSYALNSTPNGKILLAGGDIWYNGPEINLVVGLYNNSPLTINEQNIQTVKVFPNPSSNLFYITSTNSLYGNRYLLTNSLGQVLIDDVCKQQQLELNLENYSSGVFFLTLGTNRYKLIKN
jgi:uncharacterized delta-60 repeat protein